MFAFFLLLDHNPLSLVSMADATAITLGGSGRSSRRGGEKWWWGQAVASALEPPRTLPLTLPLTLAPAAGTVGL
jgi:hypothetical protein